MKNFTLLEINEMINKSLNRTLNLQQVMKMLKDIKGMDEKQANVYLKFWSTMQWFNERMNGKFAKRHTRMDVIVSCNEHKYAYIYFLLENVRCVK